MTTTPQVDAIEDLSNQTTFDDAVPAITSFDNMGLDEKVLRGIYTHGFEKPTPIQQRAIVPLMKGGDVICQAPSGTGKTGAFAVGVLQRCNFARNEPQALILSPTRELAAQSADVISKVGSYLSDSKFVANFVGGTRVGDDIRVLRSGIIVALGTPGRILDLIQRNALTTHTMKILVLDEADNMLSEGFTESVYAIFKFLPKEIQICLCSATLPDDVLELSNHFLRQPTRILVEAKKLSLKGIKQFYISVDEEFKQDTLMDLYESVSVAQSVIFCNTKSKVDAVAKKMTEESFTVSCLHAELTTQERDTVMSDFRKGSSRVLISTDLIARGIDVHSVSIVLNYDLTSDKEKYLHRIGRAGRLGKKGIAINFVTPRDVRTITDIQNHYQIEIEELPVDFAKHLE